MALTPDKLDRYIDDTAALQGLTVSPDQRSGVRLFLTIAQGMAERLEPAAAEAPFALAPVFGAGEGDNGGHRE